MKTVVSRKSLGLSVVFLAVLALLFGRPPTPAATQPPQFHLIPPAFVTDVHAQSDPSILARLDAEAGIAAYVKSPTPITLSQVTGAYRTIEAQTDTYIIGSVAVAGYNNYYDAHVYTSSDGWILAYYMRDQAGSIMLDIASKSITNTNLNTALSAVAGMAGVSTSGIQYYDFRYPNANRILLVYKAESDTRTFVITLPSSYAYNEFSFASRNYFSTRPRIDGTALDEQRVTEQGKYGVIPASLLAPGKAHTVDIGGYDGPDQDLILMITYREQP